MTVDNRIAEELVDAMNQAGMAAIATVVSSIVVKAKADVPIGDPARDPDPEVNLRDSFHVRFTPPFVTISVEAPHAVKQHEALHFKHPRGGRAKYLERHVAAARNELQDEMTASVRTYLQSGRVRVRWGEGLRP